MRVDRYRIKIEAENRGWSQRELARRAGINPSVLSRIANGGEAFPATVKRIANALGTTVSEIADR